MNENYSISGQHFLEKKIKSVGFLASVSLLAGVKLPISKSTQDPAKVEPMLRIIII